MKIFYTILLILISGIGFAADYNSAYTGAQIDSGAKAGNDVAGVTGIVTSNGAGTISAATTIFVTGRIDGLMGVTLSTANAATTISSTSNKVMTYYNRGDSDAHSVYTTPTFEAGQMYCIRNYTGITAVIKIQLLAGQYMDVDGVNTAAGKAVKSGGALGDSACFQVVDSTHAVLWMNSGLWSIDNS